MDILRKFLKWFRNMNAKKRAYFIVVLLVFLIMSWAFISAGVITGNFNRAQLKGSENKQKVDAYGVIITETKEGKKYLYKVKKG